VGNPLNRRAVARAGRRATTKRGRPARSRPAGRTPPAKLEPSHLLAAFCALCSVVVVGLGSLATYKMAQAQLDQLRRDHAAQRFLDASAQLTQARKTGDLRTGAVRSLEILMKESPELQAQIVAQLATFVRTNATAQLRRDTRGAWIESSSDVVAAVRALAARPDNPQDVPPDISGARLALPSVDLENGRLADTDLDGAVLAKAHLGGADLSGARLTYANLRKADLRGARLRGANLSHGYLTGADFTGADLRDADLSSAVVSAEDLQCARVDESTRLPPAVTRPTPDITRCGTNPEAASAGHGPN
jgi:uncharacterized protein YjbI with pentapeptide repeats